MYCFGSQPSAENMDEVVSHYSSNPALLGYCIVDVPYANELSRVQSTVEYLNQADPNHVTYVNLHPIYSAGLLNFGDLDGEYVTPKTPVGQTF